MMLKCALISLMSMSIVLSLIPTPLTLGLFMLMMTLMGTMISIIITNSWMAMIIFLVYVGGLLVLFAYFLAIQPNQLTNMSIFMLLSFNTFLMLTMFTSSLHYTSILHFYTNLLSLPYIMFNENLSLVILLGVALLLILIVVVKITYAKSGPLRPFN